MAVRNIPYSYYKHAVKEGDKLLGVILHTGYYNSITYRSMCRIPLNPAYYTLCGPGRSVGIATGYGLDGPGIEFRWGARFSAPVQTGPGAHPVSCTIGTGSFSGVKSGRGMTLTPHPLLVPWS
jgi:hypothetical protein